MAIRYVKILLIVFVALVCLLYATQNVVNLDAAYLFVATAMGMDGQAAYPDALGPAISNPTLLWVALSAIIALEYTAGVLSAKGAWDLFRARHGDAAEFQAAKKYAILGGGVAMLVWFGLFTTLGGAYFQMWQTDLGNASLQGAFQLSASIGIVMLFVNMTDR